MQASPATLTLPPLRGWKFSPDFFCSTIYAHSIFEGLKKIHGGQYFVKKMVSDEYMLYFANFSAKKSSICKKNCKTVAIKSFADKKKSIF